MDNTGLVLDESDATEMSSCLLLHLRCTEWLAGYFWTADVKVFKMRPKHHYTWHVAMDLPKMRINPKVFNNTEEESFLGKCKRIARQCHGRSMHRRIFSRYLIAMTMFLRG